MEEGITINEIIRRAIDDRLTLEIDYIKNGYEYSTRTISEITESDEYGHGYISAFCHMRNEQRTFKIDRIRDARIVTSQRRKVMPNLNYEFDASKPIFKLYGEQY